MKKIIFLLTFVLISKNSLSDDKIKLGLEVFNNKAQCGVCHSLKSAGSNGQIGPSLDILKPQISQTIMAVTNGIGVMPAWEGILTEEEIEAVAYYIFMNTNK